MASLAKNIVANYLGRGWTFLLSILLIPVYLRFLGIEAYGLVGFYMVLISTLSIFDFGISNTMNRELARLSVNTDSASVQRDLVRTLELIYWGIAILAGVIIILLAPYIAHTWIKAENIPQTTILKTIQLMAIAVALQFPISLYQGGLMGLERQVLVNVILALIGTLRSVGAILVLWLVSPTIEAFFIWQVVSSILGSIVFFAAMWLSLPKHAQEPRFRKKVISGIWKYAAAISANSIIGVVLVQLDKVILSRMLTLRNFGYYCLATTVASAIWMIIVPFNNALFPRFVQLHENKEAQELRVFLHRSAQVLSFVLLPVCALIIVFSKDILFLWMHDISIVQNCHLIVSLLVFGIMLNGIASIPSYSAAAFGWPHLVTYTNAIQAIFAIPLIIGLVYWLHGVGAAIAWVIMNSTYVIFMAPVYFRRYFKEEQVGWYLRDVTLPALMVFSVCLLLSLLGPVMHNRLFILSKLTVIGFIAMVAAGFTLPYVRNLFYSKLNSKNICVK